jgi:DNA-binding transcriptional regulator LsrR (DeoR family)
MQRELTKVAFAKTLNISRPTLDKLLKERRRNNISGNK